MSIQTFTATDSNTTIVTNLNANFAELSSLKASLANFVVGETPTGAIDGSNVTFTLANTPVAVLFVSVDGVMFGPASYGVSGTTLTVGLAPTNSLLITYIK